jgi:hypothetical protein
VQSNLKLKIVISQKNHVRTDNLIEFQSLKMLSILIFVSKNRVMDGTLLEAENKNTCYGRGHESDLGEVNWRQQFDALISF